MNIICLGGGPAGLYFALSMKLRNPDHQVTVLERNRADDTFGWGVVLSDETLAQLRANDPVSARLIGDNFAHWDDVEVVVHGERHRSSGHGFCGIGRLRLLQILQQRCEALGVDIRYQTNVSVDDIERYRREYDLVIAADGLHSQVRSQYAEAFQPAIDTRRNRFVWLGTHRMFDAFTFLFEPTEWGLFWAHAYKFDQDTSTFIVECSPETWARAGIEQMSKEDGVALCEKIFAAHLDGHALMSNAAHLRGSAIWLQFPRVTCERWYHDNVILLGDAAHTAHFSIGSGTKLGVEDAITLAELLNQPIDQATALARYQEVRALEVLRITNAARNSTAWFEDVENYLHLKPLQFTYALLTRSQRVSHENLRLRDRNWLREVERWFASTSPVAREPDAPPMFVPYQLRDLTIANRVVVSPMSMYSALDGVPSDFHLVHYGALAKGGAGLLFTEMTDVSAEGRISPGCAGLWNDAQQGAWTRIVDFVHASSRAKFCLQLGHAGPKASTRVGWEGDNLPRESGNWPVLSASAIPYAPGNQVPRAMDRHDMARVTQQFVDATRRADACGFDMLELHCAHGYLLSAFITPLLNQRTDDYGGSLENRLRFPLEVFRAVRDAWPAYKPMSVRISATDWHDNGITSDDAVSIARAFRDAGVDIIDVSAGQTTPEAQPRYGRMFQTPFADRIRNEVGMPTMAVGNITESDQINSILVSGRADLCCLGRPHLADPFWTLRAAADLGYDAQAWPVQYLPGKEQMARNAARARSTEAGA
ncbi:MAG: bifunctional salicylyl-CoA 5-hydroxylase/oxidoreductase [Pseudomonadales bacterium]|nr:bifunctional salicylyl-CoA 5-hydroxylase/oxidoreductase [Pseudomonadales bacterium]